MNDLSTIVQMASKQINHFTGVTVERIVGLTKRDQGWCLECEVVERQGIPNTMDLLGLYEFDLDDEGNIEQFRRKSSRHRGDTIDAS